MSLNPITKTAADVATYVKRQFGDESGVQIDDSDIFRWLNAAQLQLVAKIAPIKAKGTTDIVAGQKVYDIAGLSVHQTESVHYQGNYLPGISFSDAEQRIVTLESSDDTGAPAFWYEWAGQIYLYPVPAISITGGLEIFYTKMPTNIVLGTDLLSVPDKFFEAVVAWVLSKAYELDEEFDQANTQRQVFDNQILEQNGEELRSMNITYPVITFVED